MKALGTSTLQVIKQDEIPDTTETANNSISTYNHTGVYTKAQFKLGMEGQYFKFRYSLACCYTVDVEVTEAPLPLCYVNLSINCHPCSVLALTAIVTVLYQTEIADRLLENCTVIYCKLR
jgi:hypothetical protein